MRRAGGQKRGVRGRKLYVESLEVRQLLAVGPIITEFLADNANSLTDVDGENSDWIEIFNPTEAPVSLAGYHLTDDSADLDLWTFPEITLSPGEFKVVFASGKDRVDPAAELHTNFRLSLDGEYLALVAPDGVTKLSEFAPGFPAQQEDVSYGLAQGVNSVTLLPSGAPGRALVPDAVNGPTLGTLWTNRGFSDESWEAGTTGWGYDLQPTYRSLIGTDLQAEMFGVNTSVYLRTTFDVDDPAAISQLILRMKYDDGFIAYLNGQRVADVAAPFTPSWNSDANDLHDDNLAMIFEDFDISAFRGALVEGENVLAIQGLNFGVGSSDFLILPEITAILPGEVEDRLGFFKTPTPGTVNNTPPTDGFVADTKFSVDRGFFDAPFDVAITTETADATIRYTLDGSEPTATNGFDYTGPINIASTTVLRAAAFKPGFEPSNVDAQTYIFLEDVIHQSPTGQPPSGWPSNWGGNEVNYGMNQTIVNENAATIIDDLKSIPSMSIVMDLDDLFGPAGIYANPGGQGMNWEREASLELVNPDGSEGFQINAGIRIRGGFSRSESNPKHAFRFFFRGEYGDGKLNFPLFGDEGASEFDNIDLRTDQNYSWSFQGDSRHTAVRDVFSRDTQRDMGQPYTRSRYYHLYINGQYWGMYQTQERAEAAYGETYFGGEKENYDVVKAEAGSYDTRATDGNLDAFFRFWSGANSVAAAPTEAQRSELYQRLMGNNPDGTRNPAYEVLLDADNLIDYMLVITYGGNLDAPISAFLGNTRVNNWFGMRDRTGGSGGWKFFAHDNEHTLLDVNENRMGPFGAGSSFTYANPQWIWQQLWASADFRLRVADRIQKHFYNGGALTPEKAIERFQSRANEIDRAIIGESARWGDAQTGSPFRRSNWLSAIAQVTNSYLPARGAVVLNQLASRGLTSSLTPPTLGSYGGEVEPGTRVGIFATGTAYYTTDGTDPRLPNGAINPTAQLVEAGEEATIFDSTQPAKYFVPTSQNGGSSMGTNWTGLNFDDSSWTPGTMAAGYDTGSTYDGIITTDVQQAMQGVNASIYFRTEFNLANPGILSGLNLRVKYDDGFIIFLNGQRVASRNAPTGRFGYSSPATQEHPDNQAVVYESIALENVQSLLRTGRNVLAIQGMNRAVADDDFLFAAEMFTFTSVGGTEIVLNENTVIRARSLVGNQWSAEVQAEFTLPSPLRITEIMYNPLAPAGSPYVGTDFEFLELRNIGTHPLNLQEYQIQDGVTFTFGDVTLAPGAYALVVNNQEAFASRYGDGLPVVGEFEGNLSNGGETLTLVATFDSVIQQFAYSDSWYASTDGEGLSLTIVDDSAPLDAWGTAAGWKASAQSGGSPGSADVPQTPGDTDGDGDVDLADLNNVRNHFGATGEDVPGDTNGDHVVDLADLNAVRNNFGASQQLVAPTNARTWRSQPAFVASESQFIRRQEKDSLQALDAVFAQLTSSDISPVRKASRFRNG